MKVFFIPLAATLFVATACNAEGIFKCITESGVAYQATVCAGGAIATEVELSAGPPARIAIGPEDDAATAVPGPAAPAAMPVVHPAAGPSQPVPARRASGNNVNSSRDQLQAGMSDLQVLNNRRWGKPQRITRTRDSRAWHEHWDYETGANGGKQLHFVNGTLAGIEEINQLASTPLPTGKVSVAVMAER